MTTRSSVASKVDANLGGVTGTAGRTSLGMPNPFEPAGYPFAIYNIDEPDPFEQITMGTSGTIEYSYDVEIWLVLGRADADGPRMATAALQYADMMRAAFTTDPTLSGTVFDTNLIQGNNNIKTYLDDGQRPQLTYILRVTEMRTASAGAS